MTISANPTTDYSTNDHGPNADDFLAAIEGPNDDFDMETAKQHCPDDTTTPVNTPPRTDATACIDTNKIHEPPATTTTMTTMTTYPDKTVPAPEIGPGWTKIIKSFGPYSKTPGRLYHYFLSPKNKHRFRSMVQAQRFLARLEVVGNEMEAYRTYAQTPVKTVAKKSARSNSSRSRTTKHHNDNNDVKDPPPKRPPSTYLMYTRELRFKIIKEHPSLGPVETSRMLGEIWKKVPPLEKEKLKKEYEKQIGVYRQKMAEWKRRNPGKSKQQKKKKRGSSLASSSSSPRKKSKKENIEWWAVEGFRDRRINKDTGKEEYLIKWKGCPEATNSWEPAECLNVHDDAKTWWQQELARRESKALQQKRIDHSMKVLGLDELLSSGEDDEDDDDAKHEDSMGTNDENLTDAIETANDTKALTNAACQRILSPAEGATRIKKVVLPEENPIEDETWKWDDASQVTFQPIRRISVHEENVRELVTEARINGTPVVLTGHVGWANFALRWLRRHREDQDATHESNNPSGEGLNTEKNGSNYEMNYQGDENGTGGKINGVENRAESNGTIGDEFKSDWKNTTDNIEANTCPTEVGKSSTCGDNGGDIITKARDEQLDLSDPSWYLDIDTMSNDIGNEEVPVVKKNYDESQPISGDILASKFFEVGWRKKASASPRKRKKSILYLHQWQFPLSVEACKKLCHQSTPLPNNILGEDLLKYWLDRVKLDSPLQYLFMGGADTMSKIHKDNGGLAISIAPITGEKEVILVHRDDGHACLYHNMAALDPNDIDLNAYPLLPHARMWKSTIRPGEILLMPHGTYHQCRNITPCLSYSRFHLDEINLRAFLHSMMDGDAPELHQDEVLWNATREIIDVVDIATDAKQKVNPDLCRAVDALRALRHVAKEVSRKLQVRQTVKGPAPSAPVVSSTVNIDGDSEVWQSLVDDVDICLHEFRYRFNKKIPAFKRRRCIGRKILALPALPFRGKAKPSDQIMYQGRNEPVVAFECPMERGFLTLPKATLDLSPEEQKVISDSIPSIVVNDEVMVRIEGRKCPATVTEVYADAHAAYMSFEDLPSVYNDFVLFDLLRTPSVSGSCLATPKPEDVNPGKLFVALVGKDEYRGVVQHLKHGRMFRAKLNLGSGYTTDKLIDECSILSVVSRHEQKS